MIEFEPYLVENCCFFEKPIWPKNAIYGTIWTPKKAYERAHFAKKKPKIHQSMHFNFCITY